MLQASPRLVVPPHGDPRHHPRMEAPPGQANARQPKGGASDLSEWSLTHSSGTHPRPTDVTGGATARFETGADTEVLHRFTPRARIRRRVIGNQRGAGRLSARPRTIRARHRHSQARMRTEQHGPWRCARRFESSPIGVDADAGHHRCATMWDVTDLLGVLDAGKHFARGCWCRPERCDALLSEVAANRMRRLRVARRSDDYRCRHGVVPPGIPPDLPRYTNSSRHTRKAP